MGPKAEHERLPDGAERWRTDRGNVTVRWPAPGLLHFTYTGHSSAELVPIINRAVREGLARHGRLLVFVDTRDATSYDREFRVGMAESMREVRDKVEVHIYMASALVRMAVSVMNLVAGGIPTRTYATTRELEAELARRTAALRGASPPRP